MERFGVHTLEFDGRRDSLLQEFDQSGRQTYGVYEAARPLPRCALSGDTARFHRTIRYGWIIIDSAGMASSSDDWGDELIG